MKLVHLFKYYWPDNGGGIAAAMDMAIHAFNSYSKGKRGNRQEIICCWQENGKKAKKEKYNGISVYRCKSLCSFASTQFSLQFIKAVEWRTRNADIVVYNFPYPLVDLGVFLHRIHGKLVIWWHCDFDTQKGRLVTALYRPLVRHTLKKADAVIVSAEGNISGSDTLEPFRNKCRVIPFAVSKEWEEQGRRHFEGGKCRPDGKVHILFIGRFVWYKGIDILLRAFSGLNDERYELVLVGDGPLFSDMQALAKNMELDNIKFTGSVSEKEKAEWIKWSDFLVLPSISKAEAFAIVQIEAMAFGKPVINTWISSGVPDVSINGESGITVKAGDEKELAAAMDRLGEDVDLRERYGKRAMELVKENYTMPVLDKRYGKLFKEWGIEP